MPECSGASFIGVGVLHRTFSEHFHVIARYLRHELVLSIPNRFAGVERESRREKERDAAVVTLAFRV